MDNTEGLVLRDNERRARRSYMFVAFAVTAFGLLTPFARKLLNIVMQHFFDIGSPTAYDWPSLARLFGPMYLIALPLSIPLFLCAKRTPLGKRKLRFSEYIQFIPIAFFAMLAGNTAGLVTNQVISSLFRTQSGTVTTDMILNGDPLAVFFFSAILAPIVEEFVFRKLIIDRVHVYGGGVAVLVSAMMFGLFHGNFSQMFGAFAVGLVFGYVYLKTGKVHYTMILHALINANANIASLLTRKILPLTDPEFIEGIQPDPGEILSVLGSFALYFVYFLFVLALVGGGVALFIVKLVKKKVKFGPEERQLPARRCIKAALVNAGMIAFFAFCLWEIVSSFFPQIGIINR